MSASADSSVQATVIEVISSLLKCEINAESSRENTLPWDSLKHVELVFAVEDELGLQFSEQQLAELSSVQAIVQAAQQIRDEA